jgi:hypothetical protein
MALHTFREALGPVGLHVLDDADDTAIQAEAQAALSRFQAIHDNLERRVRRGELPSDWARRQAEAAAAQLRATVRGRASDSSPVPKVFLDRLIAASEARARARASSTLEALQHETNRLLRSVLVEHQVQGRTAEFEAKTFHRPLAGGRAAPTLDRLLAFHQTAGLAGDEAALEWSRRQLEAIRPRTLDGESQDRIDRACDRPDAISPRRVARHLEALRAGAAADRAAFVARAVADRDPHACVAAFLLARRTPEATSLPWVRLVLSGLDVFPDAALSLLRALEAEARAEADDRARAQAERAIAIAEAQLRFPDPDPDPADPTGGPAPVPGDPAATRRAGGGVIRGRLEDDSSDNYY